MTRIACASAGAAVALAAGLLCAGPATAAEPPTTGAYRQGLVAVPGWTSTAVPAYSCPAEAPYLENRSYAPFGTTLIPGVEIVQDLPWPIGVSITHAQRGMVDRLVGVSGEALASSVTNWTPVQQYYQVVLHCTSDYDAAAPAPVGLGIVGPTTPPRTP